MDILLLFLFCLLVAALAGRKGYNPALWLFASGIVGLLVLAFLPFVNEKSPLPHHLRRKKRILGDRIGAVLSVINAAWFVYLALSR